MTHELLITAPSAESAAEIVQRIHPGSEIRAIEDTGPAADSDVLHFHRYAKANNKKVPFGSRSTQGSAA